MSFDFGEAKLFLLKIGPEFYLDYQSYSSGFSVKYSPYFGMRLTSEPGAGSNTRLHYEIETEDKIIKRYSSKTTIDFIRKREILTVLRNIRIANESFFFGLKVIGFNMDLKYVDTFSIIYMLDEL